METTNLKNLDSLPEKDKLWLEEISRETEHYYQGEKQQEERSSWLLTTASALMAIIVGTYSLIADHYSGSQELLLLITIVFYFLSAVCAIFGILPFTGIFGGRKHIGDDTSMNKKSINSFMYKRFHTDETWSLESLKNRIYYHHRNHYLRNYEKSLFVIISAMFLLFGLITSLLIAIKIITPLA